MTLQSTSSFAKANSSSGNNIATISVVDPGFDSPTARHCCNNSSEFEVVLSKRQAAEINPATLYMLLRNSASIMFFQLFCLILEMVFPTINIHVLPCHVTKG